MVEEFKRHFAKIALIREVAEQDIEASFYDLLYFVTLLHYDEYTPYFEQANKTIKNRDPKDAHYVACALAIQADFIRSEDKDFTAQTLIPVKTTAEFLESQK